MRTLPPRPRHAHYLSVPNRPSQHSHRAAPHRTLAAPQPTLAGRNNNNTRSPSNAWSGQRKPVAVMKQIISIISIVKKSAAVARHTSSSHVPRRTFLLPSVKARRRMDPRWPSCWVGLDGLCALSLPERPALCEEVEDCEVDLFRPSSARMSSRLTLRWGCVFGTSSRFSTNLDAIVAGKVWVLGGVLWVVVMWCVEVLDGWGIIFECKCKGGDGLGLCHCSGVEICSRGEVVQWSRLRGLAW